MHKWYTSFQRHQSQLEHEVRLVAVLRVLNGTKEDYDKLLPLLNKSSALRLEALYKAIAAGVIVLENGELKVSL